MAPWDPPLDPPLWSVRHPPGSVEGSLSGRVSLSTLSTTNQTGGHLTVGGCAILCIALALMYMCFSVQIRRRNFILIFSSAAATHKTYRVMYTSVVDCVGTSS